MIPVYSHPVQWSWWDGDQVNPVTHGDYTFILLRHSPEMSVIRVNMNTWAVDGPVTIPGATGDPHQQPSLLVINGILTAFRGAYGDASNVRAQYAEASGQFDSAQWGAFSPWTNLPLSAEGSPGYCFPILTGQGTVMLFHLERAHNNYVPPSDCFYYRKTASQTWAQGTWHKFIAAPVTSEAGTVAGTAWDPAIYLSRPMVNTVNGVERVGVMFHQFWPEKGLDYDATFSAYRRAGYLYSDNDGVSWKDAAGTPRAMPVGTQNSDSTLFARLGYCNFYGWLTYDDDGHPVMAVDTFTITSSGTRATAARGLSIIRWTGSSWSEVQVDPDNQGTVYYPSTQPVRHLASPKLVKIDGVWHLFSFRDDGTNLEPHRHKKVDTSPDLVNWTPSTPLFDLNDPTPNRMTRLTMWNGRAYIWRGYADQTGTWAAWSQDIQVEAVGPQFPSADPLTLPITAYVEEAPAPPEPVYADPLTLPITAWVTAAPSDTQDAFALFLEVPGDTGLTLETPAGDHYFLTIGEQ